MTDGEILKYIELYKSQIDNNRMENEVYKLDFFKEYCALNCFLNDFDRSEERLKTLIIEDIHALSANDLSDIDLSIEEIKNSFSSLGHAFKELLFNHPIEGIVFMVGDQTIDSHGMLVDGKSYLLIDIANYARSRDNYNIISFMIHELSHAIHYSIRPDMYFRNFTHSSDKVIKRLLLEGIATYITRELTNESDEDVFWLGFLDHEEIKIWMNYSEEKKFKVASNLTQFIEEGTWSSDQQYELFSIVNPDLLWQGRLAYYYGYQISKLYCERQSIEQLLNASYRDLVKSFEAYFAL